MSTTGTAAEVRDHIVETLNVKLGLGTAGLDQFERTILIVEVADASRVFDLNTVGQVVSVESHARANGDRGIRARMVVDQDVRERLGLDKRDAPALHDVPLASRAAFTSTAQAEIDSRRGPRPALRRIK